MTYVKYNESVKIGEKWASQYFELIGKSHEYCNFFFIGYAYRLQAIGHVLLLVCTSCQVVCWYKIHWQHTLTLELEVQLRSMQHKR